MKKSIQLACLRHATSVYSKPESNSQFSFLAKDTIKFYLNKYININLETLRLYQQYLIYFNNIIQEMPKKRAYLPLKKVLFFYPSRGTLYKLKHH